VAVPEAERVTADMPTGDTVDSLRGIAGCELPAGRSAVESVYLRTIRIRSLLSGVLVAV
jgi:hypothetical protein